MGETSDRRRFPRYPCTGRVEVLESGSSWGWGKVSNISPRGCYIETIQPLPFGTEVQLRLTIVSIELDLCADVVSTHLRAGMGVSFLAVSPENEIKLAQILEKVATIDLLPAIQ